MKIKISIVFIALMSMVSCDKLSSGGGGDTPAVITDPLLLATWNVTKYEALDKDYQVIDTETNLLEIADTYYKFVFDASGNMECWFSVSAGQCITTNYAYFSSSGDLLFGVDGEASVMTLNDTSLIFENKSFAPVSWYDEVTWNLKSGIQAVRVTCARHVE